MTSRPESSSEGHAETACRRTVGLTLIPPSPITDQIKDDLLRFPNFEKILCYQYPGLLTHPDACIKLGGSAAVNLYRDYCRYLATLA